MDPTIRMDLNPTKTVKAQTAQTAPKVLQEAQKVEAELGCNYKFDLCC
jgi:hypothetical protein